MTNLGPIPASLLQNATFLQNAFITTFLATLGLETVRYILGELYPDQLPADCNDKFFRAPHPIQPRKRSELRSHHGRERRMLVEL